MAGLTKFRNGFVLLFIPVFLLFMANRASAQPKVFVEEYTYQASEADSKLSSRAIALEQVKRLLLEKLGIYLESETEVRNFQLTRDQITTLTAGIVRAEIVDEKWDGRIYALKAKIEADPAEVTRSIERLRQDRQRTRELQEARRKADEALKEIEKLKKELEAAKAGKPDLGPFNKAVIRLSAADWLMQGYVQSARAEGAGADHQTAEKALKRVKGLYAAGAATARMVEEAKAAADRAETQSKQAWQAAIEAYTSAIALNPNDPEAYYHRGIAYDKLGNSRQAMDDHGTAANLGHQPARDFLRSKGLAR